MKINDNQIAEVMNNLIINAVQAMPHGGKIYVQAENLPADRIDNTIPLHFSGKELVKISVRDEGMGIPEKIREKIFDQFITTKPNGAGLGLSTSYRIIKNNHGDMNFQSQPGEGTTFNIYLPVCKDCLLYTSIPPFRSSIFIKRGIPPRERGGGAASGWHRRFSAVTEGCYIIP